MNLAPVVVPPEATAALRAFSRQAEAFVAGTPGPDEVPVEVARAANAAGAAARDPDATVEVAAGVPIRVLRPDGDAIGIYLHIHGGGWTMGAAELQDDRYARYAGAGIAVVSVDYRLAPEHPHPAAADDCEAVASWLLDHAVERFGTDRIVIGGESAGAHLSAVTLLRLRDRGRAGGICGANLVYGLYDLRLTPSVRNRGDRRIVLSLPIIRYHVAALLGPDGDPDDPDASPMYAPLHDLPPALFTVGDDDPVLDDSALLATRWQLAGNDATLDVYEGGFHAFNLFPGPVADICNDRQLAFVRNRLVPIREIEP